MSHEVLGKCPVCNDELIVTRQKCPSCNTEISGEFKLCDFCRLSAEEKKFALVFIKNRGNIREVEKELGISYPTVRSRLESLIRALGYEAEPQDYGYERKAEERKDILDELDRGEISAADAAKRLKGLGGRR